MIPILLLAVLSVPVDRTPPAPTVGDPITLSFHIATDQRIAIEPSPQYEVVSSSRARAVVRAFAPKSFTVQAAIVGPSGQRVISVIVPMKSVLAPHDSMQPAPLEPPLPAPPARLPLLAIAAAAALCAAAWAALILANRLKLAAPATREAPPAAEFLAAITALRRDSRRPARAGSLADATRRYLARVDPLRFGPELTSFELRNAIMGIVTFPRPLPEAAVAAAPHSGAITGTTSGDWSMLVSQILEAGDREKFSPWGMPAEVTDRLLESAVAIPRPFEQAVEKVAA
jgi:hypothetical protein